jgi:hypothetical protein
MNSKQSFFPNDKPRSWVIGTFTGLQALLFGVPSVLTRMIGWQVLSDMLRYCTIGCGLVVLPMMIIFQVNNLSGRYKDFKSCEWKNRPW